MLMQRTNNHPTTSHHALLQTLTRVQKKTNAEPSELLLLCSDGLWEMVRDPQIEAILATPTQNPSQTAHALIQAALIGGGVDNISDIVVQVSRLKPAPQAKYR